LPHQYGAQGYEKYRIGRDLCQFCLDRGIPTDIEVEAQHRIYGKDWYRFVASCRAMLGTESGAEIFDYDGVFKALAAKHASLPFEEFHSRFLRSVPTVRMNLLSPKIFEAIRLRTALILFEGDYSGVVQPWQHYIPLKKDYSNIDDVLARISDIDYLQDLTDRAYRDIIETERYSYRSFVEDCDRYIDARAGTNPRATIVSVPVIAMSPNGSVLPCPISLRHPILISREIAESRPMLEEWDHRLAKTIGPPTTDGAAERITPVATQSEPAEHKEDEQQERAVLASCAVAPEIATTPQRISFGTIRSSRHIVVARVMWRLLPVRLRPRVSVHVDPALRALGLIPPYQSRLRRLRLRR
jgi:hypothetical protein